MFSETSPKCVHRCHQRTAAGHASSRPASTRRERAAPGHGHQTHTRRTHTGPFMHCAPISVRASLSPREPLRTLSRGRRARRRHEPQAPLDSRWFQRGRSPVEAHFWGTPVTLSRIRPCQGSGLRAQRQWTRPASCGAFPTRTPEASARANAPLVNDDDDVVIAHTEQTPPAAAFPGAPCRAVHPVGGAVTSAALALCPRPTCGQARPGGRLDRTAMPPPPHPREHTLASPRPPPKKRVPTNTTPNSGGGVGAQVGSVCGGDRSPPSRDGSACRLRSDKLHVWSPGRALRAWLTQSRTPPPPSPHASRAAAAPPSDERRARGVLPGGSCFARRTSPGARVRGSSSELGSPPPRRATPGERARAWARVRSSRC
eukprot:scaffold644_cov353-Prasinococcus_capsulatus_cf.AAC.6